MLRRRFSLLGLVSTAVIGAALFGDAVGSSAAPGVTSIALHSVDEPKLEYQTPLVETLDQVRLAAQATPVRPAAPPEGWTRVTRVIDGDTVEVGSRYRVRLYGADAPNADQPCGQDAINSLNGLLIEYGRDNNVRLEYGIQRFESGVALAYLFVRDGDSEALIDEWMVRRGVAKARSDDGQYAGRIKTAQEAAQYERLCLWQ